MAATTPDPQPAYAQSEGVAPFATAADPNHSDPPQTPSGYTPQAGAPGQHAYSPPPGGAHPHYPPYVPPGYPQMYPGAYGYPGYPAPVVPGYPPPVGQYPHLTGSHYTLPLGQYPPHPGQYPSPPGGHYPSPAGIPPTGRTSPSTPGQYSGAPLAGQYPPPSGSSTSLYQMPNTDPNFSGHQPEYYPAPLAATQPLWYLGTTIPDPQLPPAPHGVEKVPGYDPALTYNVVTKAINSGQDIQLFSTLLPLDPLKMDALCDYAISKTGKSLQEVIEKLHTGNSFRHTLRALTLGPLGFDVELAHKALAGLGTNEMLLTELILGRSGSEIRLLIEGYRIRYGKDLVSVVKSDLSGKTERLFTMALNGQRPSDYFPVDYTQVAIDIETLHHASIKKEEIPFFEVLVNRSNPHLAAVITGFAARYKSLSKVIKKTFSGHLESSLLYIVYGAKPKHDGRGFWRDAKLLEKSMAGLGTRDTQLIYRLVRAHWDPHRLEGVKDAYRRRYDKALEVRVRGETSGEYQKLLVAIVKSSETRNI